MRTLDPGRAGRHCGRSPIGAAVCHGGCAWTAVCGQSAPQEGTRIAACGCRGDGGKAAQVRHRVAACPDCRCRVLPQERLPAARPSRHLPRGRHSAQPHAQDPALRVAEKEYKKYIKNIK